ncbi:MAG: ribonuclease P protein component [Patescibacteria group bacterium]
MVTRSQRLPADAFLGKRASKLRSRYFLVKVAGNELAINRFGVVIGKSAARLATRRHALKRQILGSLFVKKGGGKDVLIVAQGSLETVTRKQLLDDMKEIKVFIVS